jgi:nucleoside-diphosphate-sugar epimerase
MNIVLTGSTGFIGQYVLDQLIDEGHCVTCILRNESKASEKHNACKRIYYGNDSNLNIEDFKQIHAIIHLATYFTNSHKIEEINPIIESNIILGIKLLEIASVHKIPFINTSSYAQMSKENKGHPQNLYAASKESFRNFMRFYSWNNNFTIFDLELFDSYGLKDQRPKFYRLAIESFINNREFGMSQGEQEICIIHVSDISAAIIHSLSLLDQKPKYTAWTLFDESSTIKIRDLSILIRELCKSNANIQFGYYPYRVNEIFKMNSSFTKLPLWEPKISLKEGLKEIIYNEYGKN